jgi:putative transposase
MGTPFPPKLKLHHRTPGWVPDGAMFHIRARCAFATESSPTGPRLVPLHPLDPDSDQTGATRANALLKSAHFYHTRRRWHCALFLLMPDHLHALIAFPADDSMSRVIGDWKHYHTTQHGIDWQDGYFDHRIRSEHEFERKADYIRRNPVVKKLCARPEDWLWVCEPAASER